MDNETGSPEEPVTIENEEIKTELNEEQRNALTDGTVENESEQQQETQQPEAQRQGRGKPGVKAMPDGKYVVTRADGTRIELSEDEIKGLAQKRIAAATYKQREAERRADDYRARFEAAQQATAQQDGGEQADTPQNGRQSAGDDARPSWENGDWESMDQYQDALDAWRDRQAARRSGQQPAGEQGSRGDEAPTAPNEVWLAEAQRVLTEGAETFGDDWQTYVVGNDAAPFDQEFTQFLFSEVDNPAAMLLELGRNTDEANEIRQMLAEGKTVKAARALGRIEARIPTTDDDGPHSDVIEGAQSDDDDEIGRRLQAGRARKATQAPPPITPVTARSGITTRKDPDKMTQAEYEAWRAEGGG